MNRAEINLSYLFEEQFINIYTQILKLQPF